MFVTNPKNKINIDIGTASTLFNMVSKRVFEEKSNPKLFGAFVVSNDSKKIDDIVVSGGTAFAAATLIKKLDVNLVEMCFLMNIKILDGAKKLKEVAPVYSVLEI